jgi:hypothetical protein
MSIASSRHATKERGVRRASDPVAMFAEDGTCVRCFSCISAWEKLGRSLLDSSEGAGFMETIDGPVAEVPFYGGKIATDLQLVKCFSDSD